MISLLERGVTVEADVLANLKTMLPAEAAQMLDQLVPEAPNAPRPPTSPMDTIDMAPTTSGTSSTTYYQADVLASQLGETLWLSCVWTHMGYGFRGRPLGFRKRLRWHVCACFRLWPGIPDPQCCLCAQTIQAVSYNSGRNSEGRSWLTCISPSLYIFLMD